MSDNIAVLSHSFEITDISFRAIPVATQIYNEFDYFGTLLGLKRLPEEHNSEYKARLLDVFTHRANSTYTGMINGITRELGLDLYHPIQITRRTDIDPTWSPRIEFVDNKVYIWKDSATQLLDLVIDRYPRTAAGYFINKLVDLINTSSVFTATIIGNNNWTRSDCIVNQSSSQLVEQQILINSRNNSLGNTFIDRGSIVFSDKNTFKTEVSSENLVNSDGKYFIDYNNGRIKSFNIPADNTVIQYSFTQDVFKPIASPVILRSFASPEFQKIMFRQVLQPDGSTVNSTPTRLGADWINELLSVKAMYWSI